MRLLAFLTLALLLTPAAFAQSSMPPQRVWTVHSTVNMLVEENVATVKVIEDIANRGPDPEFPFQVRIPDDAFVTGLTIIRDGTPYEAQIAPREAARQAYEEQKSQQQTAGLVEKSRHSSVYAYLINVAGFTSVRAILTYERYLVADRGVYNLSVEAPVSGFGQDIGATFSATVRGAETFWSEPNAPMQGDALQLEVPPRTSDAPTPFTLSYTLAPTSGAGTLRTSLDNGTGYFVHTFRAPADADRLPVDMALVLDVSGSMTGLKMQQMKDAAIQLVRGMRDDDRLALIVFSSEASSVWPGLRAMTPANRAAAAQEVDALLAGGATNLEAALRNGFAGFGALDASAEEGRMPLFVLLTDGQATQGNTDRTSLRTLARDANTHGATVYAIAFGADADWTFIHGIAADAQGLALRVPEGVGAEVDLRRFLSTLATPTLKNVVVTYGAMPPCIDADCRDTTGVTLLGRSAPTLFAGSELLFLGTFDPAKGMPAPTITARDANGARTYTAQPVAVNASWLPRLVGHHQARALQETISAEGATPALSAALKDLGMRWHLVTDETSLVLALEPRVAPEPRPGEASNVTLVSSSGPAWSSSDASMGSTASTPMPASSTHSATIPVSSAPPASTPGTVSPFVSSSPSPTADPTMGATPSAKVPGPGLAIVVLALAAAVLVLRRRP